MRSAIVMALAGAIAAPVAIHETIGPVDPATLDPDSDLMQRAEQLAREHFTTSADITVERVYVDDHRIGAFGERIKPSHGYAFHVVLARVENTGKVDMAVSTWHFSATDDAGSDRSVELGNAHEDFDASRLGRGHARTGLLYFELPQGSYLTELRWQGELGEARGPVPSYAYP